MALKGEEDAIGHAQCAENAPTCEQPDLPRRQSQIGSIADSVIVKDMPMDHLPILSCDKSIARQAAVWPGAQSAETIHNFLLDQNCILQYHNHRLQ
jgi:hypothetical protein